MIKSDIKTVNKAENVEAEVKGAELHPSPEHVYIQAR